ncbi:MAG: thioesterase family protein [Isosphaeraceae bacterium]
MDEPISSLTAGHPVVVALPVLWGDQDAYQHVNNTVFFRWFESSRIAYWARLGLDESMRRDRVGPILASAACDFRAQVTFPDTVHVAARICRLGRTSLGLEHLVVSEAQGVVAAQGRSTMVLFDYRVNAPVELSETLRARIREVEGRDL